MYTHAFRAMNTQFHIWLDGQEAGARQALLEAEDFAREVESTLSRFLPDSALSRVNREPGRWHTIPHMMVEVIQSALAWARRTEGLFDPTVLGALYAEGYTESFEKVQAGKTRSRSDVRPAGAWQEVRLEENRLYLPPATGLDLGGIAKEWTADRMATMLSMWGPCLVDAGGDIRTIGAPWLWGSWPVTVAHPLHQEEDIARLGLQNGALTTSSRGKRQWRHNGRHTHHLIDPSTGRAADTPVLSASVLAPTAVMGGVLSKMLVLRGLDALEEIEQQYPGCTALIVLENGTVRYSYHWRHIQ